MWGELGNNKVEDLPTVVEVSEKNEGLGKPVSGSLEEAESVQAATDERREREVGNNNDNKLKLKSQG